MGIGTINHTKRNNIAGFVVVLALHLLGLYGLWSYRVIPPPSEALTVFVHFLNPASPAKIAEPAAPKPVQPAPARQESPRAVTPAVPQLLVSSAPVTSQSEAVASPPPVVKTSPAPVSSPVVSGPPSVHGAVSAPLPMLLSGELSVSCPERTAPVYPKQSLRLGEKGKTVLLVELDETGRVANVTIKAGSGFPRLDEAAVSAVKSWRCTPAKRNGVAVRSVALQPFNFILKGR